MKRPLAALVVAVVTLVATLAITRSSRTTSTRAEQLLQERRFDAAIPLLEELAAARPNDPALLNSLAWAHLNHGDAARALALYDHALDVDTEPLRRGEALWWSSGALVKLGRPHHAVERLERLTTLAPGRTVEVWRELARLRYQLGRRDEAIVALEQAAQLDPDDFETQSRLGSLLVESGQHERARAPLETARELDPRHVNTLIDLSMVSSAAGRHGEARRRLGDALALEPESGVILANIGWTYFVEGAMDKALRFFERARDVEPDDCNHVYAMAWTVIDRDPERGRALLHEVERMCPGNTQVSEHLGRLHAAGPRTIELVIDDRRPEPRRPLFLAEPRGAVPGPFARRQLATDPSDTTLRERLVVPRLDGTEVVLIDDDDDPDNGALTYARLAAAGDQLRLTVTGREVAPTAVDLPFDRPADGVRRLVVLWWDGATWSVVAPLVEVGRLPVLAAVMKRGTAAVLDSIQPTTAKALRNLTHLTTHDAYTVRDLALDTLRELNSTPDMDALIDDQLFTLIGRGEVTIWDELRARGVSALDLVFANYAVHDPYDRMLVGADGQLTPIEAPRASLSGVGEAGAASPPSPSERRELASVLPADEIESTHGRFYLQAIRLVREKNQRAIDLMRTSSPRFTLLRFDETDVISHRYWAAMETQRGGGTHALGKLVETIHEVADVALGRLVATLDGDDVVIVLADHGMANGFSHAREGIFVIAGDDVARAATLEKSLAIRAMPQLFLDLCGKGSAAAALARSTQRPTNR